MGAARQQGYKIVVDTGKQLADSLNAASDPSRPYMNTMLRMITTRCMMQAVYFASGTIEEPLFQHYGLACPNQRRCHIRRPCGQEGDPKDCREHQLQAQDG